VVSVQKFWILTEYYYEGSLFSGAEENGTTTR